MTLRDLWFQVHDLMQNDNVTLDTPVFTEGCDCDGRAGVIVVKKDHEGKTIIYVQRA